MSCGNKHDSQSGAVSCYIARAEPIPDRIACLAGDAIHNLRSALNHLAYDLFLAGSGASQNPARHVSTQSPIFSDAAEYKAKSPRKVKGMAEAGQVRFCEAGHVQFRQVEPEEDSSLFCTPSASGPPPLRPPPGLDRCPRISRQADARRYRVGDRPDLRRPGGVVPACPRCRRPGPMGHHRRAVWPGQGMTTGDRY